MQGMAGIVDEQQPMIENVAIEELPDEQHLTLANKQSRPRWLKLGLVLAAAAGSMAVAAATVAMLGGHNHVTNTQSLDFAQMNRILPNHETLDAITSFKLQSPSKGTNKYRYMIFTIKDDEIGIDSKGAWEKTWDEFGQSLTERVDNKGTPQCAYAIFDYDTTTIIFVTWIPVNAPVRQQMLYRSLAGSFKSELGSGIRLVIHVSDLANLESQMSSRRANRHS